MEMKLEQSFTILLAKLILITTLSCNYVTLSATSSSFDFNYFVQQWPGSYCDTSSGCCYPTTGKPAAEFSIHGLWPNYDNGSYPSYCGNSSNAYNETLISDMISDLQLYWPSLACPSSNGTQFWAHEWNKHGTCSDLDQRSYFEDSLDLHRRIDILAALQSAEIYPSDEAKYNASYVIQALKSNIGYTPGIQCNRDMSGSLQLYQVYFCIDTNASTIFDCTLSPSDSCFSGEFGFPEFSSVYLDVSK